MKNLHTKLEQYSQKCDELFLTKHLKALIEEAESQIEQIEVSELYVVSDNIILVDVREPEEFASGYISAHQVLTIPRGKLEFMAIDKIAKRYGEDANIVTYCLKGPRGSLAALQLRKMGFTNVKNLKGGILKWLSEGNTIHSYLGELVLTNQEVITNPTDKLVNLVNNKTNIDNQQEFKVATASIICNLIDIESPKKEQYCNLFQREFALNEEEFMRIKESIDKNRSLDENIKEIKEGLNHNQYEIMHFLETLNRFIIVDGCKDEEYEMFELIKGKLLV